MIVGHYAAAVLLRSPLRDRPFWLLLLAANIPEFFWFGLASIGVEHTEPSSVLDATLQNVQVDAIYSHNLIPAVLQAIVFMAIVFAWRKDKALALGCGALIVFHVLCDYVVGYEHQLLGKNSPALGLNTYIHTPYLALLIELIFCLAAVFVWQYSEKKKGRAIARNRLIALYATFTAGVLVWIPIATNSLRSLFQ